GGGGGVGRWRRRGAARGAGGGPAPPLAGGLGKAAGEVAALGVGGRQLEGLPVADGGLSGAAEAPEQVSPGSRQQVIAAQCAGGLEVSDQLEACGRPVRHRDRDRTVQIYHRRG